jgi:hypothetical protein
MKTLRVVIALGVLVGLGWFAPALATADGCAVVLRTPDGFLNLREGPSVETRVVSKLSRGDLLYVDTAQCGRVKGRWICDKRSEWGHVTQVPRFDGSDPRQSTSGWVSDKFVQWFECPEPKAVAIPAPAPAIAKTMPRAQALRREPNV